MITPCHRDVFGSYQGRIHNFSKYFFFHNHPLVIVKMGDALGDFHC